MTGPDLIGRSGREDLPLADRIGLLRAALRQSPPWGVQRPSTGQEVHDLRLTTGWIRGALDVHDRAVARGASEATLTRDADRILSPLECLVLAWSRGGHAEYQRVRGAQDDRGISPWAWSGPGAWDRTETTARRACPICGAIRQILESVEQATCGLPHCEAVAARRLLSCPGPRVGETGGTR